MTEVEALDVLMVLRAGLPNAYLKLTEADTAAMVALWAEMFRDYPVALVTAAAKTYIWNDKTGRFPSPGAIREEMSEIQRVVKQCAFGSTIQEYMGAASERFPAGVRDYIDQAYRQRHMELYGCQFTSQAEKFEAHRARELTDGGNSHGTHDSRAV